MSCPRCVALEQAQDAVLEWMPAEAKPDAVLPRNGNSLGLMPLDVPGFSAPRVCQRCGGVYCPKVRVQGSG